MLYILLAILAGAMLPLEGVMNGALGKRLGNPFHAAIVAFVVGLPALLIASLLLTRSLPNVATIAKSPAWMLMGGLAGAIFVTLFLSATPRLGAVAAVLAVLAGQLLVGATLDHFGWLGMTQRAMTPIRIAGLALVVAGVVLVAKK